MELQEVKKPNKLYSFKEVREFMGVGHATLYRMIKTGKIKVINLAKTGKKPLFGFRAEDVQSYYDSLPHSDRSLESVNK